jgi:Uncharacterized protein conserved in bacteria (DUF2314)
VSAAGQKGQRWRLDDAERRNRDNPDFFFIPDRTRRENLRPGDGVKLLFMLEVPDEPGGERVERMWVEVQSASERRFTGSLVNEPVTPHELTSGAEVEFGPEHLDDPNHCSGIPIGWFADRHPEIEVALRDPKPGWWVWDEGEAAYVHQPRP